MDLNCILFYRDEKVWKPLKFLIALSAVFLLWSSGAQASGLHDHRHSGTDSPFTLKAKSSHQPMHCLLKDHPLNHPCPHVKNGGKKTARILADCGAETQGTSAANGFSGKEVLMAAAAPIPMFSNGREFTESSIFYQTAFPDPIEHPPQLA